MSQLKQCTACKKEKPPTAFFKDKYRSDGLCQQCKECRRKAKVRYRSDPGNLEKSRQYGRDYYQANIEARREYDRRRARDPEARRRKQERDKKRRYTPEHREKDRKAKRKLAQNPDFIQKRREYNRHLRKTQYHKVRAREVVRKAVSRGKIPRAKNLKCDWPSCDKNADEYHHYNGYEKEHWFDIQPLCFEHHGVVHRENHLEP